MLLYAAQYSSRLAYVLDFIGKEVLGCPIEITTSLFEFRNSDLPKINYSEQRITDKEIWLKPHALLFETEINKQEIHCFHYHGHVAFFQTNGSYPFDLFAGSFYLLSRYEEYLPHQKDMYGRYAHENSLAFQNNFLNLPLINLWVRDFKNTLLNLYPTLKFTNGNFTFIPTYDIDEAYSFRYKGLTRTVGGFAKDLLTVNVNRVLRRFQVLTGKQADPFYSFEWMDKLNKRFDLDPLYFFLVPTKLSKYDRNISPQKKSIKKLIAAHADRYKVGIHPSWQSGDYPNRLIEEIQTLQAITGHPVTKSRQHFIRFSLPNTYRTLRNAGIKEDYSMGYGSVNGFRASVTSPFFWFDLEKNEQTELKIYPFCFMDANSFFEQSVSPQQALEEMKHYFYTVKKVDGTFITLWHNTFLGTDPLFKGWRDCYVAFLESTMDRWSKNL